MEKQTGKSLGRHSNIVINGVDGLFIAQNNDRHKRETEILTDIKNMACAPPHAVVMRFYSLGK